MDMEPEETGNLSRSVRIAAAIRVGEFSADRDAWAAAYAKQSRSDFAVFEMFTNQILVKQCPLLGQVEQCHSLHYLQMACEKIAKAYRFRDTATPIEDLLTSHVAFSKFIEGFLKAPDVKDMHKNKVSVLRNISRYARQYAERIELLAPALGSEKQPSNAEYPWADAMKIVIPCEYSFQDLDLLIEPEGRNFLKIIEIAITDFENIKIP